MSFSSGLTQLFSLKLKSPIRTASIGYGDNCAVITDEAGYKSTVTVYSASSREEDRHIWRWRTPDFYVQEAALSPSGTHLCALTFRQNGSQFESFLQFFDMDAGEVRASVSLGSVVGYAVHWLDDSNVAVITDRSMFTANRQGEKTSKMEYSAKDLLGYAFDENNFVIALRSWSGNARATITRYDKSGTAKATLDLETAPESLSYAGGQLGVLTSSGLYIYNNALRPDWKCMNTSAAQRVLMTEDGGAWLLYSKYAQRVTESSAIAEEFKNDSGAKYQQPIKSAGFGDYIVFGAQHCEWGKTWTDWRSGWSMRQDCGRIGRKLACKVMCAGADTNCGPTDDHCNI